jgi:hypothetical protein
MNKAQWIKKYGNQDGKLVTQAPVEVLVPEPVDSPDPEDNPVTLDGVFTIDCKFPTDQFQLEFTVKHIAGTLTISRQSPDAMRELFLTSLRRTFGGSVS